MFTVKTSIKPSKIHGMGVFLEENVVKNQKLWEFNPRFDLLFSVDEVENMCESTKELIKFYGYLDKQQFNGWHVFHSGNDRFTNHSDMPNTIPYKLEDCQYMMIASKDMNIGEELTCDYNEYEIRNF